MNTIRTTVPGFFSSLLRILKITSAARPFEPDGPRLSNSVIERWRKRMRYRWHLERLIRCEPELLADIGLTEKAAKSEIEKPFWHR